MRDIRVASAAKLLATNPEAVTMMIKYICVYVRLRIFVQLHIFCESKEWSLGEKISTLPLDVRSIWGNFILKENERKMYVT